VAGEPITDYCDRHRASTSLRLALFVQACEAIHHAHQKGIVHRDIKPSNVLVAFKDGDPQVKVIDFGVAKAISHSLTEKTIFTEQGQLIGTPEYMSPEQAEMGALDIDTRTDVYSLGVLLYELLVGALPFDSEDLRRAGLAEIQRIIREVEPPKPSTRLSGLGDAITDLARRHDSDARMLLRELRGDLDWVTMKALEKDRTRRYAAASELAADVTRYLDGEPVQARKPSLGYVVGKLLQRERGKVAAAVVALSALLLGGGALAWRAESVGRGQIISTRALVHVDQELDRRDRLYIDLKENPPATLGELLADPRTAFVMNQAPRDGYRGWWESPNPEVVRQKLSRLGEDGWRGAVAELADHASSLINADTQSTYAYERFVGNQARRLLSGDQALSSWSLDDLIARRSGLQEKAHVLPDFSRSVFLALLAIALAATAAAVRWQTRWLQWLPQLIATGGMLLLSAMGELFNGIFLYLFLIIFHGLLQRRWKELGQMLAMWAVFVALIGAIVWVKIIQDPAWLRGVEFLWLVLLLPVMMLFGRAAYRRLASPGP